MTGSRGRNRPEGSGPAASPTPDPSFPDDRDSAPAWWEVGDALWLAAHRGTARAQPPEAGPGPGPADPPEPEPAPPERSGSGDPGPAPAEPTTPPPPLPLPPAVPAPEEPPRLGARLGGPRSDLPRRQAMVRALQWFRRHRAGRHSHLDEDGTAASFAHRALADPRPDRARRTPVIPEMVPEREVADDLTLLIDDSLSMVVQQPLVADFVDLLAPLGVFRRIRTYYVDSGKAQVEDLPLRAVSGPAPPASRLVGGRGRDVVLVLTDGVGDGWHNGAVDSWLARWGASAAVGVAQLLDRAQWPGTGMSPRHLALSVPEPTGPLVVPNAAYRTRPFEPAAPALQPDLPEDTTVVPVFPLEPREVERWARFVSRRQAPPEFPTTALLTTPTGRPPTEDDGDEDADGAWDTRPVVPGERPRDAQRELGARERVDIFRVVASPTAFRLAVCLAAAPLNLATIRLVQERFVPRSRPSDLTEVLCSGLLGRTEGAPAIGREDRVTLEFHPGVRELLLAIGGHRDEIRSLLETVAAHYRETLPWFGALERLLLGAAPGIRLPPADAETAPFARSVLAALRALPGPIREAADDWWRQHGPDRPGQPEPPDWRAPLGVSAQPSPSYAPHHRDTLKDRDVAPADSQLTDSFQQAVPGGGDARVLDDGGSVPEPSQQEPRGAPPRGPEVRPAVWGPVPPRNPTFVGREPLLAELRDRLREADTTALLPSGVPQALQGMGGVGKTQLAVEFAWRHRATYELVWWIPSDTPAQIQQSLIELAPKLGVAAGGDPSATVRSVLEALQSGTPYADWLLVYDNASAPEQVKPFVPAGGPGQVLVTSRSSEWRTAGGRLLQVDTFERAESTELLLKRGPESLTLPDADRIAEKLGDLPLAVEQTAVWLYETLMPADEWLDLFDEKSSELLAEAAPTSDYPWSVAATMNLTLDQLRESNPAALQLLQVCAFLAPQPIPRRMFNGARNVEAPPELARILADPAIKLGRALRTIDRYALAKMDHRNSTFQLHRLVQETLKLPLDEEQRTRFRHCAHLLLANLDPGDPFSPQDWPRYVELLPHVWETEQWDCQSEWARQLVLSETHFLVQWGRATEAEPLGRRALEHWSDKLGAEHPQTLRASIRYAQISAALGRFQESYERTNRLVETLTRLRGADDEETLEARLDLSLDQSNLGRFRHAVETSGQVLEQQQRVFGRDDPITLQTAHIHAFGLRLTGRFTEGMEIDRYNFDRRLEIFGPEHMLTQSSRFGFAMGLMESGRYWESMQELDELHTENTRLYPADAPLRLITMLALSTVKRRTGRLREALELSEEAHRLFENRLGPDEQDTFVAAANHSVSLRAIGEHEAALSMSAESRERFRATYGDHHPLYADVSLNHAVVLRLLGRMDQARAVDEEAMAVHADRLGEDHPASVANAINLASDLIATGDAAGALEMDTTTHERARRGFGENHPLTLAALRNTLLDRRAVDGARLEAEHADLVMRYRAMFGSDHPATHSAEQGVRANCDLYVNGL